MKGEYVGWATLAFFVAVIFGSFYLMYTPATTATDGYTDSVIVKVCNNRMIIVRKPDSTHWLIRSDLFRTYRVEDVKGVCP